MHKNALVLGLGVSGVAATELLLREGTAVTAIDAGGKPQLVVTANRLTELGATVELGADNLPGGDFDLCVVSPGIADTSDWVTGMKDRSVPVISELELAWRRCKCRILAITGSNGKSTTTKLCAESLALAGNTVEIAGNYGTPLSCFVMPSESLDWLVVEVSSFQLETIVDFRPDTGVLLNVFPNHLNRHGDMQTYTDIKLRMFANMTGDDTAVVPQSMAERVNDRPGATPKTITFAAGSGADYSYAPGRISGQDGDLPLNGTQFDNESLGELAAATAAAMASCGCPASCVAEAAASFVPLPHRMQLVGNINGVRYVNDSKATNMAAVSAALRMSVPPVHLVAGGQLKETDFSAVKDLLATRAAGVYLIGTSKNTLADAWSDVARCTVCNDLADAVDKARARAEDGDTILLSPGCASFDEFRNFEDRGEVFARIVKSEVESGGR